MTDTYFTIVTDAGIQKMLEAVSEETKVSITEFGVGDGAGEYYTPTADMIALRNEVWRGEVNNIYISEQSENLLIAESVIPADAGGFTIREMGLFDETGTMIAVCNTPDVQKVRVSDGVVHELALSMEIALSNTKDMELVIDPNVVVATKKDVLKLKAEIETKQDSETGKGLSTNDFTAEYQNKLDRIEEDANKTIVDSALSETSENPVQNKVVKAAIDAKGAPVIISDTAPSDINALWVKPGGST